MWIFTRIYYYIIALKILIQNTSISQAKRQIFNRAPNFVSVPRLCTIQKTSNSLAKTYIRTTFLLNSSPVAPLKGYKSFYERKKQKQFLINPLCLIQYNWKFATASKLKFFSFIILKETTPIYFLFFLI